MPNLHTGFRFPPYVVALLDKLAARRGLKRSAYLIMLIIETARAEGIGPEDTKQGQ